LTLEVSSGDPWRISSPIERIILLLLVSCWYWSLLSYYCGGERFQEREVKKLWAWIDVCACPKKGLKSEVCYPRKKEVPGFRVPSRRLPQYSICRSTFLTINDHRQGTKTISVSIEIIVNSYCVSASDHFHAIHYLSTKTKIEPKHKSFRLLPLTRIFWFWNSQTYRNAWWSTTLNKPVIYNSLIVNRLTFKVAGHTLNGNWSPWLDRKRGRNLSMQTKVSCSRVVIFIFWQLSHLRHWHFNLDYSRTLTTCTVYSYSSTL
jgi:hypothetical protein